MRDFRRSLIRILVTTCFLLFVAWIGLKLLKYNGNWDQLFYEAQGWFEGIWQKLLELVDPLRESLEPKIQELIENVQGFSGAKPM